MNEPSPSRESEIPLPETAPAPSASERALAFVEVVLCSDYPTQLALAAAFAAFGVVPMRDGGLSLSYVAMLSLADAALLVALIVFILRARGEDPREALFGTAPILDELRAEIGRAHV